MTDDLRHLETWAAPLVAKLSSQGRRALGRIIGADLRASQQKRIAAQLNPDGTAFAPRKKGTMRDRRGRIRKRKAAMFAKLRLARYLRVSQSDQGVSVGFTGHASRIARVHQYGLNDKPAPNAPDVRYARRQLLGFTEADRELVRNHLLDHLKN